LDSCWECCSTAVADPAAVGEAEDLVVEAAGAEAEASAALAAEARAVAEPAEVGKRHSERMTTEHTEVTEKIDGSGKTDF